MAGIVERHSGAGEVLTITGGGVGTAFKIGDLVDLDDGTVIIGAENACIGIALTDDEASADIDVELLDPNAIYRMYYDGTTATTLIGDALTITWTTTVQEAKTYATYADVYCVGLYDAAGTVDGRILVRFSPRLHFIGRTS